MTLTKSNTRRPARFSLLALLLPLLFIHVAHAQQEGGIVSLGNASGAPGNVVTVTFEFENTEGAEILEARARIQGIEAFSQVDISQMCDSSAAFVVACALNDSNRLVIIAANPTGVAVQSFSGNIRFTIDPDTPGGTQVPLEWNAPEDQDLLFTPSEAHNGMVSIVTDGPLVSLDPNTLEFGEQEFGQAGSPLTIQATNTGNADGLEIANVFTGSENFTVSADGCSQSELAQGESCAIDVTFTPITDGALSDALSVETNVGTRSAGLSGTATAARLTLDPEPGTIDFGVVGVGDSASVAGQITNTGTAPLDVECTLEPGSNDFQTQPDPLVATGIAPSTSIDFALTFAPDSGAEQSASLNCQTNAIDQPELDYLLIAPGLFIFSDRFEP